VPRRLVGNGVEPHPGRVIVRQVADHRPKGRGVAVIGRTSFPGSVSPCRRIR
jgi:hypothetical protein